MLVGALLAVCAVGLLSVLAGAKLGPRAPAAPDGEHAAASRGADEVEGPDAFLPYDPHDPEVDPDESGPADPTLSAEQRKRVLAMLATDPVAKAVLAGRPYDIELGPWAETNGGKQELVGATGQITFTRPQTWPEREWPVTGYDGDPDDPEGATGPYKRYSFRASAAHIRVMLLDVDLRLGKVVGLEPMTLPPLGPAGTESGPQPKVVPAPGQAILRASSADARD
jgi:hypothetical protein